MFNITEIFIHHVISYDILGLIWLRSVFMTLSQKGYEMRFSKSYISITGSHLSIASLKPRKKMSVTYYMSLDSFYTPRRKYKTRGFLMFSGGMERDQ